MDSQRATIRYLFRSVESCTVSGCNEGVLSQVRRVSDKSLKSPKSESPDETSSWILKFLHFFIHYGVFLHSGVIDKGILSFLSQQITSEVNISVRTAMSLIDNNWEL